VTESLPPEDPRDALIREQAERIAALEALVGDLREKLEMALRAGSRNSGNSSMPPSSDDRPGRKPPRRERRAAERAGRRKQGKQPGSPGASMTWEVPDRTEDHFPEGNQACLSHLLRDFEDCAETYTGAVWPAQAQRALRGLIREWHRAVDQGLPAIPEDALAPLEREFRHAVLVGLASVRRVPGPKTTVKQKPGRELLEFCKDRQADVLRFTTDTRIWPTNNISERGVRPLKTQQKISGRLASDDVTQDRLDIRSYIDTARKHGRNAMDILHQLMLGTPWRPPAQAFSP
jgi:hypothetical protein